LNAVQTARIGFSQGNDFLIFGTSVQTDSFLIVESDPDANGQPGATVTMEANRLVPQCYALVKCHFLSGSTVLCKGSKHSTISEIHATLAGVKKASLRAKRSNPEKRRIEKTLDCFVTSFLAMTPSFFAPSREVGLRSRRPRSPPRSPREAVFMDSATPLRSAQNGGNFFVTFVFFVVKLFFSA
jgi:hypothetical protein